MSGKPEKKETFRIRFRQMISHLFLHNWGFKLIALMISVILWAGLISQDETLTRDKYFDDVSVNITGTDTMKRNGYIVTSDLSEVLNDVEAVAAVPQKQYERAEVASYNIRVDLSRITGIGEQELKLQSTGSSTYGRITSLNPSSVMVNVEDYVVRYRIPVSVSIAGEIPGGWYMTTPSVDPPLVAVSGPRDLVNSISRARVFLDPDEVDWTEGATAFSAGIKLYNRSGEEVNDRLLEVSYDGVLLDSVVLETTIMPTVSYDVANLIGTINSVADGYEMKAFHVSPENITVAARSEVLSQIGDLALSEHYIDLNGLTETTSYQIKVSKPSDDAVLSNDTITVTVDVGPKEAESSADNGGE